VSDDEVAIVVAVGPLNRGKSRLGPTLDAAGRRELVLAMLDDVLAAVGAAHAGPSYVVTPDEGVEPVATARGALLIEDAGEGTNAAIVAALADHRVANAGAVLVVQGDLPHLRPADIQRCLEALAVDAPTALLVPNDDGGTSVLGLRPPLAMATAFGPESGDRHRAGAIEAGIRLHEVGIDSLAADVDTVADLERVRSQVGPATAAVLETVGSMLDGTTAR
jgi:2-phospho-L-lactate guanylyltransferase